ncbi:MAG: hypothetical protein K8S25_08480 [Alphaproteobacteria bacterium]|nr:hypothetical protein [Alphaproteobacteria bacterium]
MRVRFVWALLSLAFVFPAAASDAPSCRAAQESDNPMVTSEDYGIVRCNLRQVPRFHVQDFDESERAQGYSQRSSSDPMVWSPTQWGSTLFRGYRRAYDDRYDRRVRSVEQAPLLRQRVVSAGTNDTARTIGQNWLRAMTTSPTRKQGPQLRIFGAQDPTPRTARRADLDSRALANVRGDCPNCRAASTPVHARCARPGMLILAWDGHRGVPVCPLTGPWSGRIMLPPTDYGHDEG